MMITWDEPKRLKTLAERGLDFADVTPAFFARAIIRDAKLGRYGAIGILNGRTVHVVFAPLGTEAISVISLRPASKKERDLYDKKS